MFRNTSPKHPGEEFYIFTVDEIFRYVFTGPRRVTNRSHNGRVLGTLKRYYGVSSRRPLRTWGLIVAGRTDDRPNNNDDDDDVYGSRAVVFHVIYLYTIFDLAENGFPGRETGV